MSKPQYCRDYALCPDRDLEMHHPVGRADGSDDERQEGRRRRTEAGIDPAAEDRTDPAQPGQQVAIT